MSEEQERQALARDIIRASGPMPKPERHLNWLLGLGVYALRERLKLIETPRSLRTATSLRTTRGLRCS